MTTADPSGADVKRVVVITGGSRGIGAATARLAAERGYAVCVSYLTERDAAHRVVEDGARRGGSAIAVPVDVTREADVVRLFETARSELGPVTALVNNAGVLETQMPLAEMDADRLRRVIEANVLGALLCAREAVRHMSTARGGPGGGIVNVSSRAAVLGSPNEYVDYAASKGAVDSLTVGLAREVAAEGIRVNAVRPALIHTDIHAAGGDPGRVERLKARVPMQRGGQAHEVARAILWLLSDEASFSTGTFVDVSGGL